MSVERMKPITLRAHFDGKRICPDQPLNMEPDTELFVTLIPITDTDLEHGDWSRLSGSGLSNAYAADEPDYPLSLIKDPNPEYEGR